MKFSVKDLFSKCDQSRRKLRIWSHLLEKPLTENFIFLCSVNTNYSIFIKNESLILLVLSFSESLIKIKNT